MIDKITEIESYEEAELEVRKIWREMDKLEARILIYTDNWIENENELKRLRQCSPTAYGLEKIDELKCENQDYDELMKQHRLEIAKFEVQVEELRSLQF